MSNVRKLNGATVAGLLTIGFLAAVAIKLFAGATLFEAFLDHAVIMVSTLAVLSWFWGAFFVIDRLKKPVIGWSLVVVGIVGLLLTMQWIFS